MVTRDLVSLFRKTRILVTPPGARIRTRLKDDLIFSGRNKPGYGGRGIYLARESIEPEIELLSYFLERGGVFVDVGANTGIYTLKAGRLVGESGIVLSLEPFPNILSDLFDNVKMNLLNNVRIRGICASDHTGTDVFWTNFGKPNSFSLKQRDLKAHAFSVMKMSLTDLLKIEQIERCDYIKIDAEGSESEIIQGASELINNFRPIIQAEVTISEGNLAPEGYLVFQAKYVNGKLSPNRLFIPSESRHVKTAERYCVRL